MSKTTQRLLLLSAITLFTLPACGPSEATPDLLADLGEDEEGLTPLGRDKPFVIRAAAEETSGAAIGHLGQQRASHPDIRDYAEGVHAEHAAMRQQLMDLASRRGSFLPTSMSRGGSRQAALLTARAEAVFDRDFLVLQVQLQQAAQAQLQAIHQRAKDPEVRGWAAQAAAVWGREEAYARRLHEDLFVATGMDAESDTP